MARSRQRFGAVGEPVFAALRAGRISPYDVAVYATLAYLAGGSPEWVTSQAEIARIMGASRRGVQLAIASLADAGLLDIEPHGRVYRYTMIGARDEHYGAADAPYGARDEHHGAPDAPIPGPDAIGAQHAPLWRTPLALPAHSMRHMAHGVRTYKKDQRDQRDQRGPNEEHSFLDMAEDLSGETPETPPSLATVHVIRWADICALVPSQWLRQDPALKRIIQAIEDDALRDPSHPLYGSMILRDPDTIGGWRLSPDPDVLPSIP